MKRCPKCNLVYSDPTLEFCLEDGLRLILSADTETEIPTVSIPRGPVSRAAENTVQFPVSAQAGEVPAARPVAKLDQPAAAAAPPAAESPRALTQAESPASQGERVLQLAPLVISLAHNWWQWVYLNNQYYYSFSSYVFSANFLMWLLLLAAGAGAGLLALRLSKNKGFAIAGLVILAVNLLLILVPKR